MNRPAASPALPHSDWTDWVTRVTDGASAHRIGVVLGRSHSTILEWKKQPTCRAVLELAVEYRADVVSGLVAAGYLSRDDLDRINLDETIRLFPSMKLSGEIHRRITERTEQLANESGTVTDALL